MTDQSTHIQSSSIDELLATYRDLQSQFERVRDRVRRAEDQKNTVPRRIYDRVRSEYDRELDAIRVRMSPIRDEIDRMQESLETQMRDAASVLQSVEEELAEAEFRHRIGEYEDITFTELRRDLDARAHDASSRQTLLQTTLAAVASLRHPDANLETPSAPHMPANEDFSEIDIERDSGEPAAVESEPAVEEVVPRRPVLSAGSVTTTSRTDGFENPHDWISEMGADRRTRPVPAPRPVSPPDPADQLDSLLTPSATPGEGFPSLVFVSGAHAGQAIALLPTTLTIGREHDNNIEIKDPEVARYHARILRERDDYVVEDLSSSTGTYINGERIKRAVITHGDVIRVGQTELALDFEWTTDSR